jgi:site-specific recombinase XerD
MTELRQKMIKAMELRDLSENTQRGYLQAVTGLAKHYRTPPDQLCQEMIDDYLLYLKNDLRRAPKTCGVAKAAFTFLYNNVLSDDGISINFSIRRHNRTLPVVLTPDQVWKIINAATNIKHRLLLMTTYSGGLRASEVVVLKPEHLDSKAMLIKVENGKGSKQRDTLLSEKLLNELRQYYKRYRRQKWLFPSAQTGKPIWTRTLYKIYEEARKKAGVPKGKGPHTLRHCFASHLLDAGYDIRKIQLLMGHKSLSSTMIYLHVSRETLSKLKSPVDLFAPENDGAKEDAHDSDN